MQTYCGDQMYSFFSRFSKYFSEIDPMPTVLLNIFRISPVRCCIHYIVRIINTQAFLLNWSYTMFFISILSNKNGNTMQSRSGP